MSHRVRNAFRRYDIVLELLCVIVTIAALEPSFLSPANLTNILRQSSIIGMLAVGMTFVILTSGIDLSVGSVLALTGVACATLEHWEYWDLPVLAVVTATLLFGALIGTVNGLVITVGKVTPFVVTLGMMSIARGLTLIWTNGQPISKFGPAFRFIATGEILRIPVPIILFTLTVLGAAVVLKNTAFGRYVYAIGGNEEAARLSGVPVTFCKTAAYAICGLTSALGAIVLTSRLDSAESIAGDGLELDVIAAVVIGGTSLMGGRGGVWGTLFGTLLIAAVNNGMVLLGISSYYQLVVKGVIIVAAVLLDRLRA